MLICLDLISQIIIVISGDVAMGSQNKCDKNISFEFFPARTSEAMEKLAQTALDLAQSAPDYFSVTFGAGGSTREATKETVRHIAQHTAIETVPHISCIGISKDAVLNILTHYRSAGISKLFVLRGDMPSGSVGYGDFQYANELVAFIRQQTNDHFHIEVAGYPECHPQAKTIASDLRYLKQKVEAGADGVVTQYFYNADAYFCFVEACQKSAIDVPIVPGIMPITNYHRLARFSEACGAELPSWIARRLQDFGDDTLAIRAFGEDVVTALCQRLLAGGAPGLHIYTMNQSAASQAIVSNLNLSA